jgi:hypothetical protein
MNPGWPTTSEMITRPSVRVTSPASDASSLAAPAVMRSERALARRRTAS